MNKLLKYVATPVLAAVVMLGAAAPGIASADTHETDGAPTDRVLTDRPTDRARDHRVTDARRSDSIGRVELREPHVLEARGTGYVALAGRLDVSGVAYGRSVTIQDLGGDAHIRVEARASRTNDDGTTTFYGLNGQFEISGSHVVIKFKRVGIHFEATGTPASTSRARAGGSSTAAASSAGPPSRHPSSPGAAPPPRAAPARRHAGTPPRRRRLPSPRQPARARPRPRPPRRRLPPPAGSLPAAPARWDTDRGRRATARRARGE